MTRPRPGLVLQLFARASAAQRKRAILTIAAIAWGSLALVLLLSFGEGMQRRMAEGASGLGRNLAITWPGETGRPWKGLPSGRPIRPRYEDIALLQKSIEGLDAAVGEMRVWQVAFSWRNKTVNGRLTGTEPVYGRLRKHRPRVGGRFINALDVDRQRRVIFLGDELAVDIFGEHDPVGELLQVNKVPYTVIGVMREKFQMGTYGGPDSSNAVVPITTFKTQFGRESLSNLVLKPLNGDDMDDVIRQMHEVLGAKYGFDPEDERVLQIWNTREGAEMTDRIMIGLEVFLAIIGSLTLLIGGVGVANIMYAVVKERTREIGVMMALGARRSWIIAPIVLEGLVYTALGGLMGTLVGVVLIMIMAQVQLDSSDALAMLGMPTIDVTVAATASGVLGLIGLLAGYFPARRAASIQPAETLRHE